MKNTKSDDLDFTQDHLSFTKRSMALNQVSFSLDEDFREAKYYRDILEELSCLTQHDEVRVFINSSGGSMSGLITLINAVEETPATVTAHIVGDCHSAASIFALKCDVVTVSPYASMMIHNLSYGVGGKEADVYAHVLYTNEFAKKFMKDAYSGFLTPKEIEEVLKGKELWLNASEISLKLKAKSKKTPKVNA